MLYDRRPKWFFLISLSVLFSIGVYVYYCPNPRGDNGSTFHVFLTQTDEPLENVTKPGYFVYSETCKISQLPVREPALEKYFTPHNFKSCALGNERKPRLVGSNRTHLFVIRSALKFYALNITRKVKCNYRPFTWKYVVKNNKFGGLRPKYGKKASLSLPAAITSDEFIRAECSLNKVKIYTDFFSFVPEPRESNELSVDHREYGKRDFSNDGTAKKSVLPTRRDFHPQGKQQYSLLILGIDAVSRLNFLRQMPKTYEYLRTQYDLVDMRGYNKIGDNTFPNVVAALTGLSESELKSACWSSPESTFDSCPFLWRNFSLRGYKTLFAEDSYYMSTFNYMKSGFQSSPTDYFYNIFARESEYTIGHSRLLNAHLCIGSQLVFKTILEYTLKFTTVLKDFFYFAFVWTSSLTHDFLNLPRLGDPVLLSFVKNLKKNGNLNSTIVVLTSDHGIRWGTYRETYNGYVEERLPFLFFLLPRRFQQDHPIAYRNLVYNQHRLTTPFDLHETLKDLLDVREINNNILRGKYYESDVIDKEANGSRHGVSLFSRVPINRSCTDAGIPTHYCTCHNKLQPTSCKSAVVRRLAQRLVTHINVDLLAPVSTKCYSLKVDRVVTAQYEQVMSVRGNWTQRDYTIAVRTVPGLAVFEATVRYNRALSQTEVVGDVSRLNVYANQSHCVDEARVKLYCYCR